MRLYTCVGLWVSIVIALFVSLPAVAAVPVAPSNPGATSIQADRITWTWQDNSSDETGFTIWADSGSGAPTTSQTTTAVDVSSWIYVNLMPNWPYSFQVAATNGFQNSARTANFTRYTMAGAPSIGNSIACDKTVAMLYPPGTAFTFSNPAGFGNSGAWYMASKFKYAWNASNTHVFTGSEPDWNNGTVVQTPGAAGLYFMHLQSFNGDNVAGPTLDYGPFNINTPVLTASFAADVTIGRGCHTVQFRDLSNPGTSPITAWLWDFGDGTSTDPLRTFQNPRHVFENPGTYTVVLTVTDGQASNTRTQINYVTVTAVPIFRVDWESTVSSPDGQTWTTAYQTIQAGVDAANAIGGGEVWVAEGTYTSMTDSVVTMKTGAHIFGGFIGIGTGGNETARSQRNWKTHESIVDGEETRRCVFSTSNATLDGLTITRGRISGEGGGLLTGAKENVINCTFTGNTATSSGGGVSNREFGSPTFTNCVFASNSAGSGGGVCDGPCDSVFTNCKFRENTATTGGGMACYGSTTRLTNCTFGKNTSPYAGAAIYAGGSSITMINCTLAANTALQTGDTGGIWHNESLTVINCIVWGNSGIHQIVGGATIRHTCVSECPSDGNIDVDPLFVNLEAGDLHLEPGSLCIDSGMATGTPATDLDGHVRPQGLGVDMGAYETTPLTDTDNDGLPDADEPGQGCNPAVADAALYATLDCPSAGATFRTTPITLSGHVSSPEVNLVLVSTDNAVPWDHQCIEVASGLTWSCTWSPTTGGVYSIELWAKNRFGGYTYTGPVVVRYQPNMPVAVITAPISGKHVWNSVNITGSAGAGQLGFGSYTLAYRAGTDPSGETGWTTITTSTTEVSNGTLYSGWNVTGLTDGAYVARLRVSGWERHL